MKETPDNEFEGGLVGLLKIAWKKRRLIAFGTAGATVMIVIIVLLLPKVYMSKAAVSLSNFRRTDQEGVIKGLEIPVYRRYLELYKDLDLFRKFLKMKNYNKEWDFDSQFFNIHCKPIYAFDQDKLSIKTTENSILGMEVIGIDVSVGEAREKTGLIGEYILTTLLNMQIGDYIESIGIRSLSEIDVRKRSIIHLEFEIKNLKEKEALITNHLLKIPGIGSKTDRELVNVDASTEKYLSPQQQLVAVKVSIKDNQIQINRHLREIKISQIKMSYLERIAKYFENGRDFLVNADLLNSLITEKETFFSEKQDIESQIASYSLNEKFLKFQKRQNIFYKFISGPTLPKNHFKPKRKRIVIVGFLLAFFIFVFLALFIEGWERRK